MPKYENRVEEETKCSDFTLDDPFYCFKRKRRKSIFKIV